jgi:hypothetical protein
MKKFEILKELNALLEDRTVDEKIIEVIDKLRGTDLGQNIKTRFNYLVSLTILRPPKPRYFGKGKGGTRLFQSDLVSVLLFVDEHKEEFSFNQIAGIVKERREDLTRQICKEFNIEKYIQNPSAIIKTSIEYANEQCLFKEDLLRANVVSVMISALNMLISELKSEITALDSFQNNIGKNFCNEDHKKISNYINRKKSYEKNLKKFLDKTIIDAKSLVEKIMADED